MSTFDGFIREFPDIQVDYFRSTQGMASRRPLAGFLSHVHSDHLVGLDTLRSPFVYCSTATRALVSTLEKYPCHVNFAKGILEARKRTYKHLQNLLKPLPLDTPTTIELSPGNRIQVTLFDANHCPGSTMFLFEDEYKAALYTGDTRLEPWFVNTLVRHPCLAEYTAGLRTIDTVYLDTTFVEKGVDFQTKAEGLRELLQTVARYPSDTIFYLRAWTFGYEDIWTALAKALRSKVHVDEYKLRLYRSMAPLAAKGQSSIPSTHAYIDPVAPSLVGFMCANTAHDGCLSVQDDVRIHSCEKGLGYCPTINQTNRPVVWIRPIVCRLPHGRGEVPEVGAGGGGKDLNKEAELDVYGQGEIDRLCELISTVKDLSQEEKVDLQTLLATAVHGDRQIPIHIDPDNFQEQGQDREMDISRIRYALLETAKRQRYYKTGFALSNSKLEPKGHPTAVNELSQTITFPYSRHSSYREQCDLLDKLHPKDVWPCTFHPEEWFAGGEPVITVEDLFGQYCSGNTFRHDVEAAETYGKRPAVDGEDAQIVIDSQVTTQPDHGSNPDAVSLLETQDEQVVGGECPQDHNEHRLAQEGRRHPPRNDFDYPYFYPKTTASYVALHDGTEDSQATQISEVSGERRFASHQAAVNNAVGGGEWVHIALESTSDNHTMPDVDLGSG
ncbi:DNA repair protein [Sporothrix schenckii 1099-18]|uniref:DNA repair protein n=1 Tax=Sporothrix schenckii 1099-18 TaxID=1397361 RepID=A0A0F2MJ99_SPOSC|nr:DNA repair protein [Sporothrix schenckii 1099-18]KJR88251.1 DNA repair protein [Sporothrix schenckii 1099-18]